jgi:PAS domain S-box-containing protein
MFQYISDIHLEYLTNIPNIKKTANNLCLVGDIGHPGTFLFNKFLKRCSENYKNVFLVYGNHEYYSILRGRHKKIETMQQKIEYSKHFPKNVYFLNNSCVYFNINNQIVKNTLELDDDKKDYIKLIGSTLWSNKGPGANNFKNIFIEQDKLLTFDYQSQLFSNSKYYIIDELYKEDIQSIILTHYTTHLSVNSSAYLDNKDINHIREIFLYPKLIACINGHTHSSIDTVAPGTNIKLLANCFGYKNESQEIVQYNENAKLEINLNTPVSLSGLYSSSEINPVNILYKVMHRQNPIYNIGQVDESTSYIISTMTKDNSIIYANRSFEKLSGYSLLEIKGKNCRFLQSSNGEIKRGSIRNECDNQLLFNVKTQISKKQECQFITYNFTKKKERFINLITIIPVDINGIGYYVGFQCDISTEIYKFKLDNLDKSIIDCNVIKEITNDYSNIINDESTDTCSVSFSATISDNYSIFSIDEDNYQSRKKNIRYKHFFNENPSFLCIIDIKGFFKKLNSTFLQELGYTKQEMHNKMILDFVYSEDIAYTLKSVEDIYNKKQVSFINRYIRKDGSLIKIKWKSQLKGHIIYCIGVQYEST